MKIQEQLGFHCNSRRMRAHPKSTLASVKLLLCHTDEATIVETKQIGVAWSFTASSLGVSVLELHASENLLGIGRGRTARISALTSRNTAAEYKSLRHSSSQSPHEQLKRRQSTLPVIRNTITRH